MRPTTIDHVCLLVTNLNEAKAYFERLFDFICTPVKNDTPTLAIESEAVHFFISESTTAPPDFLRQQHISFTVDALQPIIEQLASQKIPFKTGQFNAFKYRNYKWCEWRGPDGIRLECAEIVNAAD